MCVNVFCFKCLLVFAKFAIQIISTFVVALSCLAHFLFLIELAFFLVMVALIDNIVERDGCAMHALCTGSQGPGRCGLRIRSFLYALVAKYRLQDPCPINSTSGTWLIKSITRSSFISELFLWRWLTVHHNIG